MHHAEPTKSRTLKKKKMIVDACTLT